MSDDLAAFDLVENSQRAESPEALPEETAPGGSTAAGVNAARKQQLSASTPAPVGLTVATGTVTASLPADALSSSIQALKEQQMQLREEKQKLTKDLRNAERRKQRLRQRARQLTDEDLVQVLMFRKSQKTEQDEKK